jgi:hypothetical protein
MKNSMVIPNDIQDIILYIVFNFKTNDFIKSKLENHVQELDIKETVEEGLTIKHFVIHKTIVLKVAYKFECVQNCMIFTLLPEKKLVCIYNKKTGCTFYETIKGKQFELVPDIYIHTPSIGFSLAFCYIANPESLKSKWLTIAMKVLEIK